MITLVQSIIALSTPLFGLLSIIMLHEWPAHREFDNSVLAVMLIIVVGFLALYLPLFGIALAGSKRAAVKLGGAYRYWLLAWPAIGAAPVTLFCAYHLIRDWVVGRSGSEEIGFSLNVLGSSTIYGLACGIVYCLLGELLRIKRAAVHASHPLTSRM
jgi:hypothetical protein